MTKEKILRMVLNYPNHAMADYVGYSTEAAIVESMQAYADQETAELRKELDKLSQDNIRLLKEKTELEEKLNDYRVDSVRMDYELLEAEAKSAKLVLSYEALKLFSDCINKSEDENHLAYLLQENDFHNKKNIALSAYEKGGENG